MITRITAVLALASAILLTSSAATLAYTEVGRHGTVGRYTWHETPGLPNAWCQYYRPQGIGAGYPFKGMYVYPPKAYWPTAGGLGPVGFKVKLQAHTPSGWRTRKVGAEQRALAYPDSAADFAEILVTVSHQVSAANPHRWRMMAVITWYATDGSKLGWVDVLPRWYAFGGMGQSDGRSCPRVSVA